MLEHAEDPVRFAAELARVAPAGFVQVPSRESELVYEWPFHPWLIDLRDGVLVFSPKPDEPIPGGPAMHEAYAESLFLRLGWQAHRSRWHHSVHWTGSIPVEVRGERVAHQQAEVDVERTCVMLAELGGAGRLERLPPAVRAALRCPVCQGELADEGADLLRCDGCGAGYRVAGGVPVLLAPE